MCYFVLILLCIVLISVGVNFESIDVDIKVKVLDASGRETSLHYDGGSLELTCSYSCNKGTTLNLGIQNASFENKSFEKLVTGNQTTVQYRIHISSTTLFQEYICICGSKQYPAIRINYALCDPRSVKSMMVCSKPGELCQITKTGSAECKRLEKGNCAYSNRSDIEEKLQIMLKFSKVCPMFLKQYDGRCYAEKAGLCYTLADPNSPPPHFLGSIYYPCPSEFKIFICDNNCSQKRQLVMLGWSFINLLSSFSMYCQHPFLIRINVTCTISYSKTKKLASFESVTADPNTNIGFAEQLKKLSTPNTADIVCTVTAQDRTYVQFQTNLLLFRSDTDWQYNITHTNMGMIVSQASYRVTISVTAAEGLLVCVRMRNRKCIPSSAAHNMDSFGTIVSLRQGQENSTAGFYIALFASSPKLKYVLLHDKIVYWPQGFNLTTQEPNGKSLQLGLIIAIIIVSIVVIVAVVVSGTMWWREEYGNC